MSAAIIRKIEKISRTIREIVLEGVTEEEQKILVDVVQKMNSNIEKVL